MTAIFTDDCAVFLDCGGLVAVFDAFWRVILGGHSGSRGIGQIQ
ncbi:hypothetical protein THIOSC13_570015 [uncultured Thiomicrorhabdus sp.]